jgi:hypothetical protein
MDLGRLEISKRTRGAILEALVELGKEMIAEEPKAQYVELHSAVIRSTDKLRERIIRHRFIWRAMRSAIRQ